MPTPRDAYMLTPPDLWSERLDKPYRDRASRGCWDGAKQGWFLGGGGCPPFRAAGLFVAGKKAEELVEHQKAGYESARAGGWDPAQRLRDMALDGVAAEVLYTSLGFNLLRWAAMSRQIPQCDACWRRFLAVPASRARQYPPHSERCACVCIICYPSKLPVTIKTSGVLCKENRHGIQRQQREHGSAGGSRLGVPGAVEKQVQQLLDILVY